MKKVYFTPGAEYLDTLFEANFLTSSVGIGGSTGEDLGDGGTVDPWS